MKANRMLRLLTLTLCVLVLLTSLPLYPITASAQSDSGAIKPITMGTLTSEEYYRLLYANNAALRGDLSYSFEKNGYDFQDITFDDSLINSLKQVNTALTVLSFIPYVKYVAKPISFFAKAISVYEINNNTTAMLNKLGAQLEDLYTALSKDIENQTKVLSQQMADQTSYLADKIDNAKYSEIMRNFNTTDFGGVGYYTWKKDLYTAYDQLIQYQKLGASDEDLKDAFDYLYVEAAKASKLYSALVSGEAVEDYSIQDVYYRYFLLRSSISNDVNMDEAINLCLDFSGDLYTTYLFAQTCLSLCYRYQVETLRVTYGDSFQTKGYTLSSSISADRRVSYYSEIRPYIENDNAELGTVAAELSRYYAKTLNLCETYQYTHNGQTTKVIYNQLTDVRLNSSTSVTKEGLNERYVTINNRVLAGDVLYLNRLPQALVSSLQTSYRFVTSNSDIATVTADGVVTVKASGDFSVTLMCEETAVYEMVFTSSGDFSGGRGTSTSPYLIANQNDLLTLANNNGYWAAGYHFKLGNDIAINTNLNQIGNSSNKFCAVFDGNGFTISGIRTKALFGWNAGTVKNLTLTGANVTGGGYGRYITLSVGVVCDVNSGTLENVHLKSSSISIDNPRVKNISAGDGNIYTKAALYIGGIVGENAGTVKKCTVTGSTVKGYQTNGTMGVSVLGVGAVGAPTSSVIGLGNVAGYSNGTVEDCLATGNTNYSYIKSVSGYAKTLWTDPIVYQCNAYFYMGGLVGQNNGGTVTRGVAYSNSQSKGFDKHTVNDVDIWNKEKQLSPSVTENLKSHVGAGSGTLCVTGSSNLSADELAQMTAAGWEWGNNPYLKKTAATSIEVFKRPHQVAYALNDPLNISGLVLRTNTGEFITGGYTVTGFDSSSYGEKIVTVAWKDLSTQFTVDVLCFHRHLELREATDDPNNEIVVCTDCNTTVCILNGANLPSYVQHDHVWGVGTVKKEPTHTEDGEKLYSCIKCSETKTESIPRLVDQHAFGAWQMLDETRHQRTCACGAIENAVHEWDLNNAVVTKAPTHLSSGEMVYTCVCGHTRTAPIDPLPDHTYSSWQSHNATQHKRTCPCGEVQYGTHSWDNGILTTPPTHLSTGEKTFTCTDCSATYTESVDRLSEHSFGDCQPHNELQHKQVCGCGDVIYADHTWNNGSVTKAPTHTEVGEKLYTCTGCGETYTEQLNKLSGHTYGDWQPHNELQHKKECACGDTRYDTHVWDNGAITKSPTHLEAGTKTYTCSDCGETRIETINKITDHTYSPWQNHNETQHKRVCACGNTQYGAHSWDNGALTKAPTHLNEGVRTYTCTDCGATYTEQVSKLPGHTFDCQIPDDRYLANEATCISKATYYYACACGEIGTTLYSFGSLLPHNEDAEWQVSADGHHHLCIDCGSATELLPHEFGEWTITTPATEETAGTQERSCTACGYTETETIPVIETESETVTDPESGSAQDGSDTATESGSESESGTNTANDTEAGCSATVGGSQAILLILLALAAVPLCKKRGKTC